MSGQPVPPPAVVAAVAALRAAFGDLHEMHDCGPTCSPGCVDSDYSESAYRDHDEHNADVRERIADQAEGLIGVLEEWFGAAVLSAGDSEAVR